MSGPFLILYWAKGILVDASLALTERGADQYAATWRARHVAFAAEVLSLPTLMAVYREHEARQVAELVRISQL